MHATFEDGVIELDREAIERQLRQIKIVSYSSIMMKLLNQAIMNSTMIKQQKYEPRFEIMKDPFPLIEEFVSLF